MLLTDAVQLHCVIAAEKSPSVGTTAHHNEAENVFENPTNTSAISHTQTRIRSKRDDIQNAVTALNLLGIALSVTSPAGGAIALVVGTVLPLLFPGGGDPVHVIRDIVLQERAVQQKAKLISFKLTMQDIQRTSDEHLKKQRMTSFYDIMNSDRCLFMHRDDIRKDGAYFREFAYLHLVINELMILLYPHVGSLKGDFINNARQYIRYAKFAIQKEAAEGRNLRDQLLPSIGVWSRCLLVAEPNYLVTRLLNEGNIDSGNWISLKLAGSHNNWLSCWVSGSDCTLRSCPGYDNPMERGGQYGWKCRGEVFRIHAVDDGDGPIRTCSRVGIYYSSTNDRHWWLSSFKNRLFKVNTKSCPELGNHAARLRSQCAWEVWRINVRWQTCGVPIQDRDVVSLRNEANDAIPLRQYFVIFKSDVDRNEYNNRLHC